MRPHSRQARQQILQLRELDLQPAFTAARALREDVENELGAIEHFAREKIFQIASLRRRKFVVENDRSDVLILERLLDHLRFAFADVVRRRRLLQFLRDGIDDLRTGGVRQLAQFLHRIAQIPFRDAFLFQTDQERALLFSFWLKFQSSLCAKERRALRAIHSMASAWPWRDKFSGAKLVCRRNQVNCLLA